jgi:NDP-sugar pyrophosphorylase family protein
MYNENWNKNVDQSKNEIVHIAETSVIGNSTRIITHCPIRMYKDDPRIIIEDYVWIGYNCIVLPGVRLKRGTIIGAGSVVTKDTEYFSVNAGNPCRFIRYRTGKEVLGYKALKKENVTLGLKYPNFDVLNLQDIKDIFGIPREDIDENEPLMELKKFLLPSNDWNLLTLKDVFNIYGVMI